MAAAKALVEKEKEIMTQTETYLQKYGYEPLAPPPSFCNEGVKETQAEHRCNDGLFCFGCIMIIRVKSYVFYTIRYLELVVESAKCLILRIVGLKPGSDFTTRVPVANYPGTRVPVVKINESRIYQEKVKQNHCTPSSYKTLTLNNPTPYRLFTPPQNPFSFVSSRYMIHVIALKE